MSQSTNSRSIPWPAFQFYLVAGSAVAAVSYYLSQHWPLLSYGVIVGGFVVILVVIALAVVSVLPALPVITKLLSLFLRLPGAVYVRIGWWLIRPVLLYGGADAPASRIASVQQVKAQEWQFEENFVQDLYQNWDIYCGQPRLSQDLGRSSLLLPRDSSSPLNSCVHLKARHTPKRGCIECQVYLREDALLNVGFRANLQADCWYMARVDARQGSCDGILRKDPGRQWDLIGTNNGHHTNSGGWHTLRIDISDERILFQNDSVLVAEAADPTYQRGDIIIFNEVGDAYVADFRVYYHDAPGASLIGI